MKNNKRKTTKLFIATMLFLSANLNSATHTVTNGNDAGAGSLRQAVFDANNGDTIIFVSNVSEVNLTGSDIEIDKDLTIVGGTGDEKTTIYAGSQRIFYVDVACNLAISNLILTDANHNSYAGAVLVDYGTFIANNCIFSNNTAVWGGGAVAVEYGTFIANNCVFSNNTAGYNGGAVFVGYSTFSVTNCTFTNNTAESNGGAVAVHMFSTFSATNCTFTNNTANYGYGGAVYLLDSSILIAINNTFKNNMAGVSGGAVFLMGSGSVAINSTFKNNIAGYWYGSINGGYFYHCTIDGNKATTGEGAMYAYFIYNSIITGNTVADTLNNQIDGNIGGNNLIEGENGVTRDLVFGNNTLTDSGYIMPLEYAKTAIRLTVFDIEIPLWMTMTISADSIISWLQKDQRGKERPDTGFVTFGAVEYEIVGIVNNYNETVKIYTLGHNLYLLGDEIKDAVLYNVLGQKITEFENSTIDLNPLPAGTYILEYLENDVIKSVKLLRK